MTTRAELLRSRAPGLPDDVLDELAGLPAAVVEKIAKYGTQARRDGLAHDRDRRRQRRADARNHNHYDADELAARTARAVAADGRRASESLDALTGLAQIARTANDLINAAVPQLRAAGWTDPEIARALGTSPQAVGQRFGRRKPKPQLAAENEDTFKGGES